MKQCAIVTGAAGGIGKAVAEVLSEAGHHVVIADINEQDGHELAERISGFYVHADLKNRDACRNLIDAAMNQYDRIDILVNNAGFQHVAPIDAFPEDKWDDMLKVMLTAPFLLTRYAWPHMKRNGWGRVVNIASIHALIASPNKVGYTAAKHGLLGLTRAAALEGGPHGITVNALCPAYVRTPLVENQIADQAHVNRMPEEEVVERIMLQSAAVKRIIEPEEIARLVRYLCSDDAASVTGACWTIDGGWTAR